MPRIRWEFSNSWTTGADDHRSLPIRLRMCDGNKRNSATLLIVNEAQLPIERRLPTADFLSKDIVSKFGELLRLWD